MAEAWKTQNEVSWTAACRKLGQDGAERELSKFTSHHRAKGTVLHLELRLGQMAAECVDWGPKQAAGVGVVNPEGVNWRAGLESYKNSTTGRVGMETIHRRRLADPTGIAA